VTVDSAGDTGAAPSELIDRFEFEESNNRILAEGGEPRRRRPSCWASPKAR
jgi:DNA-directed RNA polymerase subunit beta'